MDFIGQKLDEVILKLEQQGFKCQVIDNNFSVNGDTKLVTNVNFEGKIAFVTTGNFVFDVKNKNNQTENI